MQKSTAIYPVHHIAGDTISTTH